MKKMKWRRIIHSVLCGAVLCTFLSCGKEEVQTGGMQICVMDAYTLSPVEGAYVCIPEAAAAKVTDANGIAAFSGIPCTEKDAARFPEKNYGEITVLVYGEKYLPFALFHAQVYPGRRRNGPNVYLFPEDAETDTRVISMIESPPEAWVERLLAAHAPQ